MPVALRLFIVWAFLAGITILSWQLGTAHKGQVFDQNGAITAAIIGIALLKMRLIAREFMEVRYAPKWIRRLTDIWLVTVFAVLMTIYFLS